MIARPTEMSTGALQAVPGAPECMGVRDHRPAYDIYFQLETQPFRAFGSCAKSRMPLRPPVDSRLAIFAAPWHSKVERARLICGRIRRRSDSFLRRKRRLRCLAFRAVAEIWSGV